MKISVIMVCRNVEATVRSTVESFLSQAHPSKELIVVDALSGDRTLEIIQSYESPDISVVSERDAGIYDAMNKGFARFSGDAFGFLNADDTFHSPEVLSQIAECLEQQDIAAGHVSFVENHATKRQVRLWKSTPFTKGAFTRGWIQPHPGVYCRRRVYEVTGLFDPSYRIGGDYDWLLRAYELHGFSCGIVDQIVVDMAVGGTSTSGLKAIWINAIEPLRARQKWLNAGPIDYAFLAKSLYKLSQVRPFASRTGDTDRSPKA